MARALTRAGVSFVVSVCAAGVELVVPGSAARTVLRDSQPTPSNSGSITGHVEINDKASESDPPVHEVPTDATAAPGKALFGAQMNSDILAGFVFALISALALSAGIGGGGFFVPLLVLIVGFDVHASTALSQACLAGGSITATAYSVQAAHPSGKGPLIDWNLLVITSPPLLLGSLCGSFLNKWIPDIGILVLLDVVLVYAFYTTIRKAVNAWRKETSARLGGGAVESKTVVAAAPPAAPVNVELRAGPPVPAAFVPPAPQSAAAVGARPSGGGHPLGEVALFAATWLLVIVSTFVRGSKKCPGLVPSGSPAYWLLTALTALALLALSVAGKRRVVGKSQQTTIEGHLAYTGDMVRTLRIWSLGGGVVAALCGIGGGMIMGPILLEVGVIPQVQSATTGAMLLVVSTSTAIGYIVQGAAPLDYSMFFACSTGIGALLGKMCITAMIQRFGRPSLVIFLLAILILVSVTLMTATGIVKVLAS